MAKNSKNILVVDDEEKIAEVIKALFEKEGFVVFCAKTGKEALMVARTQNLAIILLDLMLPDIGGEEVCAQIRRFSRVPILMLTAKMKEQDLLNGFALGADDYLTKPFRLKELLARTQAILRRTQKDQVPLFTKASYRHGDLIVDFQKQQFFKDEKEIMLTKNESGILSALMKYPGKVFTREELIELVFTDSFDGNDRTIDSHIKNLRQKIEDNPKEPVYIITVHRLGYKFVGE